MKTCPHAHTRWFRHGNTVHRRCLACDATLGRDSVVTSLPAVLSLANQEDPAELAAFERTRY